MNKYYEYKGTEKNVHNKIAVRDSKNAPEGYERIKANKWLREAAAYGAIPTLRDLGNGEFGLL